MSSVKLIVNGTHIDQAAKDQSFALGLSELDIRRALRTVGYIDEVLALPEIIRTLQAMKGRLHALREVLPNLPKTLDDFLLVAELDPSICQAEGYEKTGWFGGSSAVEKNFLGWFVYHNVKKKPLDHLLAEPPLALDLLLVRWVYSSVSRRFSDQFPALKDASGPPRVNPNIEIEEIKRQVDDSSNHPAINKGAELAGYQAWLSEISSLDSPPVRSKWASKGKTPDNSIQIPFFYNRLKAAQEFYVEPPALEEATPLPALNERQLLRSHWYFPTPDEFKGLEKFFTEQLKYGAPNFLEAGLIALATFTCRTVDSVLGWRLYPADSKCPPVDRITWVTFYKSKYDSFPVSNPAWFRPEHNVKGARAELILPYELGAWINLHSAGFGSPQLIDLLPISNENWHQRAYACLATALGCSPERAELITRDVIPRLIYHETANSALARFWRTNSVNKIDRSDRVALSHYLSVSGSRALASFDHACSQIFPKYKWNNGNILNVQLGTAKLKDDEVIQITSALIQRSEAADTASAAFNTKAELSAFITIAATGHRRSTQPFPFPWDFSLHEGLVFIADKLVTGSEARFVPLAGVCKTQLRMYAKTLKKYSKDARLSEEVREYMRSVALFLDGTTTPPTRAIVKRDAFPFGVFFLVSDNGQRILKTISTGHLDGVIEKETAIKQTVLRLRPTVAQHLWSRGCSGRAVQTFLGHQPEMHSHGPSSSWSVRDWADSVLPALENYLRRVDKVINGGDQPDPASIDTSCFTSAYVPSLKTAELGYEGRERENEWAQQRARDFIRRELSEYLLEDIGTEISESEFSRIRERVKVELANDPKAQDKVTRELAGQLTALRKSLALKVTAASANLHTLSAGPVGVEFSRALRCASVFRALWEANVGVSIGSARFNELERLAHLAISLVCFDAVLTTEHLRGAVLCAATGNVRFHDDRLVLRCQVQTPTHDYEASFLPGTISNGLILGIETATDEVDLKKLWLDIQKRAGEILRKLLNINEGKPWSLYQLTQIFKPYWLIRLPGAIYAVSIGEYKGPAADSWSEAQLLGDKPPTGDLAKIKVKPKLSNKNGTQSEALSDLKTFFTNTRGIREKGESRSKGQRKRLKEALDSDLALKLSRWRSQTQIVDLLYSFISRLLDSGGPREKILAHSTIDKYFMLVARIMVELAWHIDFETVSAETLTGIFESASAKIANKDVNFILILFNSHLRDTANTPYCGPKWSNVRHPKRIRSTVVHPLLIQQTVKALLKQDEIVAQEAALIISLDSGYGLRKLEAFGLSAGAFPVNSKAGVRIQTTPIGDLKTVRGRRVIGGFIGADMLSKVVKTAVNTSRTSPRQKQFLLEDYSGNALIHNIERINAFAISVLRQVTGHPGVVTHHLRHSFATIVGLAIFARNDNCVLDRICASLLGEKYQEKVGAILNAPQDWPFVVDALSRVLGHRGVTTLLNTYFHGSSLVIHDRCSRWEPKELQDVRLAAILNRERSSTTKLRNKIQARNQADAPGWIQLIQSEILRHSKAIDQPETESSPGPLTASQVTPWPVFSRILLYRQNHQLSIEEMINYAVSSLGIDRKTLERFTERYSSLVVDLGFDDFEPENSQLIRPLQKHQQGVRRGEKEREEFLAAVEGLKQRFPDFSVGFLRLMSMWSDRVDSSDPRLICSNQEDLTETLVVLGVLGTNQDQLVLAIHGNHGDAWLEEVSKEYPTAQWSSVRASRGNPRVVPSEVSVSIAQRENSAVPDGRDFHRALVVLQLCYTATLPSPVEYQTARHC